MTTTARPVAAPAGRRGPRRRRIVDAAIAVGVLLAGGLTATGILRDLDHQYGPVEAGSMYGPASLTGFVEDKADPSSYQLSQRPDATAHLLALFDNLGAHSVKITSIDTTRVVSEIRWSVYRTPPGVSVSGEDTPWHVFPATIPAGGTIRLLLTLHRPDDCDRYPRMSGVSTARYGGRHRVNWESLLHSHVTFVDLMGDDGIRVC